MTLRHFLEIDDLTVQELTAVLDASEVEHGPLLAGKGVALVFEKPSLRTRNASEMAVVQLGGHPAYIANVEIQLGKRETTEDITRTLHGYFVAIAARVFEHSRLERMAAVSEVPVINLLSDSGHPVQTLADLLTIRQHVGPLDGVTIGWVGDFSNVARSLALGAAMLGASFRVCTPNGFGPLDADLDRIGGVAVGNATISVHTKPEEAVAGVDVVSTDAWYSMGQEDEKESRRRAFEGFRVDERMMAAAGGSAIFLHCLPAHREEEVTSAVLDSAQSRIWPQAHNRMHTFRGLLAWLVAQGSIA